MPPPEQLQAARYQASYQWPYLSALLYSLQPVSKPGVMTMGVDKWHRLYYDPEWVEKQPTAQLASALYHECGHLLRDHHGRAETLLNKQLAHWSLVWNLAGDCEINDDLAKEEAVKFWKEPEPAVPGMFSLPDGETVEFYYERLLENVKVISIPVVGVGRGACGSSSGNPFPWEDPYGQGEAPGVPHAEGELIKQQVAHDVESHEKSRGTVPGWLKRWASERLSPVVDWRRELATTIRRAQDFVAGRIEYSYRRISRRVLACPEIVLPGMQQPVPWGAIVLDTSGSMSEKELARCLGEINGVLAACGLTGLRVFVTDHAVHSARKVFDASQIELVGGGGTDMRLGVAAALESRPRPNFIIVLTDGETPWPEAPIGIPLVATLVSGDKSGVPAWARKIVIPIPDSA